MNEKFTKGEWSVYEYPDGASVVVDSTFGFIGIENVAIDLQYEEKGFGHWADNDSLYKDITLEEQIANAHLIAAAPEMYEMLKLALSYMEGDNIEDFTYKYKEIEKLLTEARGETYE